jgi:glucan phosphorylase
MQQRWINTSQTYFDVKRKVACYLSAEFLLGPHLGNNLVNLNLEQAARAVVISMLCCAHDSVLLLTRTSHHDMGGHR